MPNTNSEKSKSGPPVASPDNAVDKPDAEAGGKKPRGAAAVAAALVEAQDGPTVIKHTTAMEDEREATASGAARIVEEVAKLKVEMVVPAIERFARLLASPNSRVIQTAAHCLPGLSRTAPAKVAKQLPTLTENWQHTNEVGKDGLVRTFAGLCTASVAYQKRLEPALERALQEAAPKTLQTWTEVVLPALKGEPHARARAVVEDRLPNLPRPVGQKLADYLGVKLRPVRR